MRGEMSVPGAVVKFCLMDEPLYRKYSVHCYCYWRQQVQMDVSCSTHTARGGKILKKESHWSAICLLHREASCVREFPENTGSLNWGRCSECSKAQSTSTLVFEFYYWLKLCVINVLFYALLTFLLILSHQRKGSPTIPELTEFDQKSMQETRKFLISSRFYWLSWVLLTFRIPATNDARVMVSKQGWHSGNLDKKILSWANILLQGTEGVHGNQPWGEWPPAILSLPILIAEYHLY